MIRSTHRVAPLLKMLAQHNVQTKYRQNHILGNIELKDIPKLAQSSFPLCMSQGYNSLLSRSHARHGLRMQLGLFLKGIGLSLENSLKFWQQAFSKKFDANTFQKNYAYNIRHNYGKEGKRTNYTPYNCIKIITSSAGGTNDGHGCPFRHYDENKLTFTLKQKQVKSQYIDEIKNFIQGKHYNLACQIYFKAMHNDQEPDDAISHPNKYFESSIRFWKKKSGKM